MLGSLAGSWYWYALMGLLMGLLGGAFGVGGGILMVPALVLLMGFEQKVAQGTSLAVMVAVALTGALRYYFNPSMKMNLGVVALLIPFAIIGSNLGSSVAAWASGAALRRCFAVLLILAGVRMLWKK